MDKSSLLAIKGGKRVRENSFAPWPAYDSSHYEEISRMMIDSKLWRGIGMPACWTGKESENIAEKFESLMSSYIEAPYLFCVNSGTTALEIALQTLNLSRGDEVIVTPYSYFASASAIKRAGATPVFADISHQTLNMDVQSVEKLITERTKALIVVHFGGIPAPMGRILNLAQKHNLRVIEDCAHALTAKWHGKNVGTIGDIGCFSFQGTKLLTAGEGGALSTCSEEYAKIMYSLHNGGRDLLKEKSDFHALLGGNYRISEIQAALLYLGWDLFLKQEKRRKENVLYFYKQLNKIEGFHLVETEESHIDRNYYIISLYYRKEFFQGLSRKRFVTLLNSEGIPCTTGYRYPLYQYPVLLDKKEDLEKYRSLCPVTEKVVSSVIWFDHTLFIGTKKDVDHILEAILKVKNNVEQILPRKK